MPTGMKTNGAKNRSTRTFQLEECLMLDQSLVSTAADHEHYLRNNAHLFAVGMQKTHSVTPFAQECNYAIDTLSRCHKLFVGHEKSTARALRHIRANYEASIKGKRLTAAMRERIQDFVQLESTLKEIKGIMQAHKEVFYSWFEAFEYDPTAFTLHLTCERTPTGAYKMAYYEIQDPNAKPIGYIDAEISSDAHGNQSATWRIADTCAGFELLPKQVQTEAYTYPQTALCAYLYAFRRYTLPDRWVMDCDKHLVED